MSDNKPHKLSKRTYFHSILLSVIVILSILPFISHPPFPIPVLRASITSACPTGKPEILLNPRIDLPLTLHRYISFHRNARFCLNSSTSCAVNPDLLIHYCPTLPLTHVTLPTILHTVQFAALLAILSQRLLLLHCPALDYHLTPSTIDWRMPHHPLAKSQNLDWTFLQSNQLPIPHPQNPITFNPRIHHFAHAVAHLPSITLRSNASLTTLHTMLRNPSLFVTHRDLIRDHPPHEVLRYISRSLFRPSFPTRSQLRTTAAFQFADDKRHIAVHIAENMTTRMREAVIHCVSMEISQHYESLRTIFLLADASIQVSEFFNQLVQVHNFDVRLVTYSLPSFASSVFNAECPSESQAIVHAVALARSVAVVSTGSSFDTVAYHLGSTADVIVPVPYSKSVTCRRQQFNK